MIGQKADLFLPDLVLHIVTTKLGIVKDARKHLVDKPQENQEILLQYRWYNGQDSNPILRKYELEVISI